MNSGTVFKWNESDEQRWKKMKGVICPIRCVPEEEFSVFKRFAHTKSPPREYCPFFMEHMIMTQVKT